MMNATGIAVGRDGLIYISSRFDGMVYQVTPTGNMSVFVEEWALQPVLFSMTKIISMSATQRHGV